MTRHLLPKKDPNPNNRQLRGCGRIGVIDRNRMVKVVKLLGFDMSPIYTDPDTAWCRTRLPGCWTNLYRNIDLFEIDRRFDELFPESFRKKDRALGRSEMHAF